MTTKKRKPIGVLGGGQLGRMLALFGIYPLGYEAMVWGQDIQEPGCQIGLPLLSPFDSEQAAHILAGEVDLVTIEWENIPVELLEALIRYGCTCYPGPEVLRVTQDRLLEKQLAQKLGFGTAPFQLLEDAFVETKIEGKVRVKTRRGGYDGHDQWALDTLRSLDRLPPDLIHRGCIVEGHVDFLCELSVIVARRVDGVKMCYPAVQNFHENGILRRTVWPSPHINKVIEKHAQRMAMAIADELNVVGLLAVEMFLTNDGTLLINELAPRPHNSGHWTIDACVTSQFEQLTRAILGLPFGSTEILYPFEMVNLLGAEIYNVPTLLNDPNIKVHNYGKAHVKLGRKMGHYTRRLRP